MKQKILNVLVGSDIEVFVKNTITGTIISAEGLIGGTKKNPLPLERKGCALQEDNVMAEFNVPATNNPMDMYDNIVYTLNTITSRLPEGFDIEIAASAVIPEEFLQTPQAQEIGCDPDFNAWLDNVNTPPEIGSLNGLRSCGGHIHISYDNPNKTTSNEIIKALDLFLTLPSIIKDTDTRRREIYGKAGAHRLKSYGVELRTLSNFWIKDRESVKFIFNGIAKAINFVNEGKRLSIHDSTFLVQTINNQNVVAAEELINKFKVLEHETTTAFVPVLAY